MSWLRDDCNAPFILCCHHLFLRVELLELLSLTSGVFLSLFQILSQHFVVPLVFVKLYLQTGHLSHLLLEPLDLSQKGVGLLFLGFGVAKLHSVFLYFIVLLFYVQDFKLFFFD